MSSVKITDLTEKNTCNLCNNALAKYSCPKCNLLYCSLPCYQSEAHLECSEDFYKKLIQEHIATDTDGKDEAKRKMEEILKKFHESNQMDDESEEELDSDDEPDTMHNIGERLAGIDLDDSEEVWKHLTEAERKDFEAFLMSGDVAQFIPMWTPWWEFSQRDKVLDLEELNKHKETCPKIAKNIKQFNEISKKPPASCVKNNMINVLASYTFLVRYFNGEHAEFPKEFCGFLFNIALNIKENVNYDTPLLAIESVKSQCIECEAMGLTTDKENMDHIKEDINCILAGPHSTERKFYILCVLSDIKTMLTAAKNDQSNVESPSGSGEFFEKFTAKQSKAAAEFKKENIKLAIRKIDYYLSFVNDHYAH